MGVILLEDGQVIRGDSAGASTTAYGELCFNTGNYGYEEILTDPSYCGQVLMLTTPYLGNYGICQEESESGKIQVEGLVCNSLSFFYSREKAKMSVHEWFLSQNKPIIYNVDVRSIVKKIRTKGTVNCVISTENKPIEELKEILINVPSMKGLELASKVSTKKNYVVGDLDGDKIVVVDFGVKKSIIEELLKRRCTAIVVNCFSKTKEILEIEPSGVVLSNGPGDPSAMGYALPTISELLKEGIPILGICLGHQLLALALGCRTYKLKYGHRGINHPVMDLKLKKSFITSQNHGFAVELNDIKKSKDISLRFIHLNDGTLMGFEHKDLPLISVQFHPEVSPGPYDTTYIFDEFMEKVVSYRRNLMEWGVGILRQG